MAFPAHATEHDKHNNKQLSLTNRATHLCKRNGVADIGGGALYAVYAKAYTVFLCVC